MRGRTFIFGLFITLSTPAALLPHDAPEDTVLLTTQWRSQTAIIAVSTKGRNAVVPLTPVSGKTPACYSLLAIEGDQLYATKVRAGESGRRISDPTARSMLIRPDLSGVSAAADRVPPSPPRWPLTALPLSCGLLGPRTSSAGKAEGDP